jgi:hypothetical protein
VQRLDTGDAILTKDKLPVPTEHDEQKRFVWWFRVQYPMVKIIAIPNGGARSKATAGRLKAEGVTPGVPDLFIPEWRLWIEMKRTKGGSVSKEQKIMIDYLQSVGYSVKLCFGFDDAIKQVREFTSEI